MSPKIRWLLFFLFVLALVAIFGVLVKTAAINQPQSVPVSVSQSVVNVKIGKAAVRAKIAKTSEERRRGLSGVSELADGEGMIFFFETPAIETFWMKEMLIPIDIIWIRGGAVTGIEENVPQPLPETPDRLLPRYTSSVPIDTVLEVPAGFAHRAGVAVGDPVSIPE